jgi:hypothetical protein
VFERALAFRTMRGASHGGARVPHGARASLGRARVRHGARASSGSRPHVLRAAEGRGLTPVARRAQAP